MRRAQAAIDELWPYTGEMFDVDDSERGLIDAGIAVDPATVARALAEDDRRRRRRGDAGVAEATTGCSRAAAAAGTASISAISSSEMQSMPADLSGGDMVDGRPQTIAICAGAPGRRPRTVVDPEIPVLTIADLGVLREVAGP